MTSKKTLTVGILLIIAICVAVFILVFPKSDSIKEIELQPTESLNGETGAIQALKQMVPQDDTAIDVIVATYYDLTLHYGAVNEHSLFYMLEPSDFFAQFYEESDSTEERTMTRNEIFKTAFLIPDSKAWGFDMPWPTGAGIGGEVAGRKLLDPSTMLVYGVYGVQSYAGAAGPGCKGEGERIDKFVFKKIDGQWRISEIEGAVDGWTTTEDSTTEPCVHLNQDKIEKYRTGNF